MAESTLSIDYTEIRRRLGRRLGKDRNPSNWGSDEVTDMDDCIKAGYARFLDPPPLPGQTTSHTWSFRLPLIDLTTEAPYTTGTIAVASGTVTGTGTTWSSTNVDDVPTDYELLVSGNTYNVATYSSDTSITIDDTSASIAAGTSYELRRLWYLLPDDFGGLVGKLTYQNEYNTLFPIEETAEQNIRVSRQRTTASGQPYKYALQWKAATESSSEGQRCRITYYPTPDAVYYLRGKQWLIPPMISASDPYPLGGQMMAELLMASIWLQSDIEFNDGADRESLEREFYTRLAAAVSRDRKSFMPDSVGKNRDRSSYEDTYYHAGPNDPRDWRDSRWLVTVGGVTPD